MMTSKSLTKAIRYLAFSVFGIARVASAQDPIERNADEVGGEVQAFLDSHFAEGIGGLVVAIVGLLVPVLRVRFLYQRKIFIRL